ncbi:NAD(P)H-flavin reductase [Parashewanella curva]|uniref:NAD(P)H-flavin reductase n=1 Tax=Parashewanella curva TaxID=2338552 RepID=A0A3L8PZD3_9GAMM|nr:NAD(P)H-flavin reductase [Parashewanella curva]RLV60510.1 NAD(P)H-flavin reductase [Parashewanella curva]
MNTLSCQVTRITPFNDSVYQVVLTPSQPFEFKAGQYLSIIMGEKDKRPFSIASAPHQTEIELHIGAAVAESYPMQVIERLQSCLANQETIGIEAPAGNAFLRSEHTRPRLLIAGGTGFSYIKSMIEQQIEERNDTPVTFYWGCRTTEAMYYHSIAQDWQQTYPWLTFIPVVEEADEHWQGKQANLLEQIKTDYTDVSDFDIYIAGRFDMAAAARDMLRSLNVNEKHLYGDAYMFLKG